MHTVYLPKENLDQSTILLDDKAEIHHLRNVLRIKKGGMVRVFNGKGQEAQGKILSICAATVSIELQSLKNAQKTKTILILACAIPKKTKFEYIIEKCTELGVDEIIPLTTKRTEVQLKGERRQKKEERFQTVAINAAKQSKRLSIPRISPVTSFADALNSLTEDTLAVIPHLEGERQELIDTLRLSHDKKKIMFFIGPEGDFTPAEVALASKAGCIPVSLGQTVLKVDTASIYVMSACRLFISTFKAS